MISSGLSASSSTSTIALTARQSNEVDSQILNRIPRRTRKRFVLSRLTIAQRVDEMPRRRNQLTGFNMTFRVLEDLSTGLREIVFDAYGTLFDLKTIAAECDKLYPGQGDEVARVWRTKQLEYTWL